MCPKQSYQGGKTPSPQNIMPPSHISIASNKAHVETLSEGENSIPRSNPLEYNQVSLALPCHPSEASTSETVSIETQHIQELVQQGVSQIHWDVWEIIRRVCEGIDLAFGPGGMFTYRVLQEIDYQQYPPPLSIVQCSRQHP